MNRLSHAMLYFAIVVLGLLGAKWLAPSSSRYALSRVDGRLTFTNAGADVRVVPQELTELPLLRDFDDVAALTALADRFEQHEYQPGDVIVEEGRPQDAVILIAHGKVDKIGRGEYGDQTVLGVHAGGEYFGDQVLAGPQGEWGFTVKAVTPVIALALPWDVFERLNGEAGGLRAHIQRAFAAGPARRARRARGGR
ncbi:cyclic nucleotide-binding domain-containing protein [Saccharothrix sp. MB29]|nr:cyclic nucleotide-binding domain-containing protein [Saccharothrix sp. MB29]